MQYYFGQFRLSIDTVELFYNEEVVSIDPKMFEVLCFFCLNTDRVISRDELLTQIWKNSIVSDNTLNKLIASLRKSLHDDAKQPKFIQTVPKIGYRFICPVSHYPSNKEKNTLVKTEDEKQTAKQKTAFSQYRSLALITLVGLILLSLLSWKYIFPNSVTETNNSIDIQTLTRMEGDKFSPIVAPDGKNLAFLTRQADEDKLWLKSLESNKLNEIPHTFEHIDQIVQWQSSYEIVLLVKNKGKKNIVRGQIVDNTLHLLSQTLANIEGWQVFDIAAIKNNRLFMIATAPQKNAPALYTFNFFKAEIEHIPLNIGENEMLRRLDINPKQTRILLLSKHYDDSTSLYQLNIKNNAQRHYHTFVNIVRNAIWQHDGEGIFYTATTPAQKIMALNAVKKQAPIIATSSSEYLCCDMARIPDGKNLIYRTNTKNFTIDWLSKEEYAINNSTVFDMLPKLFHHQPALAFISKREGRSQVYVQQSEQGAKAISNFDNYKVFGNLAISFDDSKLLATEANRIHIFDLNNPSDSLKPKTIHLNGRVRFATWLSRNIFAVSHYDVNQSIITLYNQHGESLKRLPNRWQGILADSSNYAIYLIDHEQRLHQTTAQNILSLDILQPELIGFINHPVNRDTKINNGKLYQIPKHQNTLQISETRAPEKVIESHTLGSSYGFDAVDDAVVFSNLKYASTELHRTK